ncbi:MAG: insulinase family protein, partial [Bacteroidia bacterium]|nr:insulinase family protein [Bacteroidia bacterium]
LDVQRKVVAEEFKEHYLSKPYGDVWHRIKELAYTKHPYRWMTIGKELSHIENAQLDDVKKFFFKFYRPNNAIMVVAGNVTVEKAKGLAEKWFSDIPSGEKYIRNIAQEPRQTEERNLEIKAHVPLDALYKCWHIYPRLDKKHYITELLSDILSGGGSSRLYQSLVKEKKLFSNIECHDFGTTDADLMMIDGKLVKGVKMETAEKALEQELDRIKNDLINESELQKVKNKTESMITFEDMSVMNRANSLAYYELLGDASLMNSELEKFDAVTTGDILTESQNIFRKENCSTIHYLSDN